VADGFPDWLGAIPDVSPMTQTAGAVCGLTTSGAGTSDMIGSLAWTLGILHVFIPLSVRQYRRRT
jgi:hypothetical protein